MNNAEYLKQKSISPGTITYSELLNALESYGDNHWWMSDNPRTRAYYQTLDQRNSFILPYQQYINDLGVLLGREVQVYEIRMSNKAILRQEVEQAWQEGTALEDATIHSH